MTIEDTPHNRRLLAAEIGHYVRHALTADQLADVRARNAQDRDHEAAYDHLDGGEIQMQAARAVFGEDADPTEDAAFAMLTEAWNLASDAGFDLLGPFPMLPTLDATPSKPITEDRIERAAESLMDRADAALMKHERATQAGYELWCTFLDQWTDRLHSKTA